MQYLDMRRTVLAVLAICVVYSHVDAWAAPPALSAGAAKTKVTPPKEIPQLTSSGAGTAAPFEGVHDDLFARALVLDDGKQSIAILAVDSIGYDNDILGPGRDFTRELRERVAAKTGLKAETILLCASHTHSAPETLDLSAFRSFPGASEWLERHLVDLADTVIQAWQRRVPVSIRAGSITASGLNRNRRIQLKAGGESRRGPLPKPEEVSTPWALDESLQVLYLETMEGKPHSVLLNFTAHPIVAANLPVVSADFTGVGTNFIEERLPGSICLFTNGCAGNVNSIHVATTFEDMEADGRRFGQYGLDCIKRLKSDAAMTDPRLACVSETIELSNRPTLSLDESRKLAEAQPTWENQARLRLALKLAKGPIRAEVQAMSIGPVRWVTLPCEAFVETGLALKKSGAAFVVGYANGYLGYVPTRRAYDEGGYEVELRAFSRVAPGSDERLQSVAERLLARLAKAQ